MVMGSDRPGREPRGVKPGELVLSGELLGDIYLGRSRLERPAIAKLNQK
jgi:phosphate transport system substrate-binding protein